MKQVRDEDRTLTFSKKIVNTTMILVLGILLGIFSKYLDNMTLSDDIWWHNILEFLGECKLICALE